MRYAAETAVSADSSKAEIERTLRRYHANGFVYGWQENRALIGFSMQGRQIKFLLPLPDSDEYSRSPTGLKRSRTVATRAWEQACRQRWRALALVIKAKLESVEVGISEFETEFLGNLVLPSGATMAEWAKPQIAEAYESGQMPALLLGAGSA